jgi:hypothetical protein
MLPVGLSDRSPQQRVVLRFHPNVGSRSLIRINGNCACFLGSTVMFCITGLKPIVCLFSGFTMDKSIGLDPIEWGNYDSSQRSPALVARLDRCGEPVASTHDDRGTTWQCRFISRNRLGLDSGNALLAFHSRDARIDSGGDGNADRRLRSGYDRVSIGISIVMWVT